MWSKSARKITVIERSKCNRPELRAVHLANYFRIDRNVNWIMNVWIESESELMWGLGRGLGSGSDTPKA